MTLSIYSRADALRLLDELEPSIDPEWDAWKAEWLTRIAYGYTPCSCEARHKGECGRTQNQTAQQTLDFGSGSLG
jgi:hypothetical protein